MTKSDFDPSKLNNENTNAKQDDILANINEVKKDEEKKPEIDLQTLSTFLTDSEIRPDELKKIDEEKKENAYQNNTSNIYDININSIDDLIYILEKNGYDFAMIEPTWEFVKISFKKEQVVKETKNIKFHIYLNILLQAKKISKLNLEDNTNEQKWSWEYKFKDKNLDVLSKTVPSSFWEVLYIKVKESEKVGQKKQNVKKSLTVGQAFWFLWTILFIALVLWAAFLTFVVFNAKTPSDVSFFTNLWINLNDINSFLLKITTFIFSVVVLVQTILLIILLFKWILTKKEFKRKKIILLVSATILLIITWSTWTLWITLDKAIKNLPNWQEMSYWNIQIYDNDLLKSPNFDKSNALISNYTTIIWPIDLKFDLNYLQKDEARRWFQIQKYIWDFGDGEKIESQTPEIIRNFSKKWNYKINLTLEWIDNRFPNKITSKPVADIPTISISHIVKIIENTLPNWWKTISFDASDLKPLWEIEWYFKEDLTKPAFIWEYFQPSKIYFEEDAIWMTIKRKSWLWDYMNRVFIISWEKSKISWEIKEEVSIDNDLNYTLRVEKLENTPWEWFIKNFKWILEGKEINKDADILKLDESSEVNYTFKNYWKQIVKVIITNTAWKSTEIQKEINIQKKLETKNLIEFIGQDNSKIEDVKYDDKTREYSLFNILVPTKITFDAKYIRADNPLYMLDEITWDIWSDWSIDNKEKYIEQSFDIPWFKEITVNYKFVHRKDKNEIINIKDKIKLELVEKEALVLFEVKTDSEYVPVIASFDASNSKVKNDNIVKFIYDYGDWVIEERDAINPWHKYLKEWNYKIKLTIVTEKWKEYSASKTLTLKSPISEWKINVSMRKAPVLQEIDFLSAWSVWQIVWYHWDFGDWNTSNEANPSHAYSKPWEYKVVLTLEYANNNIITLDTTVQITE